MRSQRENAGSYIIKYIWRDDYHAGEVINIFHHQQTGILDESLFTEVRWMKHLSISPLAGGDPWEDLYVVSSHRIVLLMLSSTARSSKLKHGVFVNIGH